MAKASPVKGAPNCVVTPRAEGTPVPVVRHGALPPDVERGIDGLEGGIATRGVMVIKGASALGVRATDGGLRPPLPSSVAPSGIPTRPTDDTEGDEADAVGPAKGLLPIEAQVPDAVPVTPPPSNSKVPGVPMLEVAAPKDACGIEPPMPEHVVLLLVVAPVGDGPEIIGLTPGDASSIAPKGTRVRATGEPGPMPSGDVMPRGEAPGEMLIPPTCAGAEPQPKRTAAVVAIIRRVIVGFDLILNWLRGARPAGHPANEI
jgi:hypothetical protein